ncbi:unnamed protein product, partial [Medioppia subpectinata]
MGSIDGIIDYTLTLTLSPIITFSATDHNSNALTLISRDQTLGHILQAIESMGMSSKRLREDIDEEEDNGKRLCRSHTYDSHSVTQRSGDQTVGANDGNNGAKKCFNCVQQKRDKEMIS